MIRLKLSTVFGLLFIFAGILIPPSSLIKLIRGTPPIDLQEKLLTGAILLKVNLVVLGLLITFLSRILVSKSEFNKEKSLNDDKGDFLPVTLIIILFASLGLRIYGLDYGLWFDEILTYTKYAKMPFGTIISNYDSENNHILYNFLSHFSFMIFGESTWSLRLPAVFFGIGSIWALYLLGREVSTKKEALFSAALLAFSYQHIWFSQNARGYTGLLFWTIVASLLLVRGLREGRTYVWLLYAFSSALGMYTHITMVFVIIGHFIIYFLVLISRRKDVWPERWVGLFIGFFLSVFFTFLLYSIVLPQIFDTFNKESGLSIASWKNPLWTAVEFVKGMKLSFNSGFASISAIIVFFIGLLSFKRKNPVIIQLLMIPALLGTTVVIGLGHHLWPRFFFFTIGFGILIVIRGTMEIGNLAKRLLKLNYDKSVHIGTVLCVILILLSAISIPFAYAPKQDYLGALAYVKEESKPGDVTVTVGLATFAYKNFYKVDWRAVESLDDLNFIKSCAKRTWLLYTLPIHMQAEYPEIMNSIKQNFKLIKQFNGSLNNGTIFVCRSDV